MKVIREYEKLRLDTSSDQIIKEFATYIDIPSIQTAIYKLTNLQISFRFQYMRELLRIIRERLEAIVIYIEDDLGYEIDERMKQILTTAEHLEEAVEALEDYDSSNSDREMPEQRDVQERTEEVKTTIDLILPPEIIVAIADTGKKGAEDVAKDSGKTVVTTATVVTEAPKETTKEAETVKTTAQETVDAISHAGSGAAIDTIIDAINNGATSINVAGITSILVTGGAAAGAATVAAAAATGTAALVASGEVGLIGAGLAGLGAHGVVNAAGGAAIVAGGATVLGGAAAGGLLGVGIAGGAILINEVGKVLEEQERTHLAEAIEHAKEAVEEAIANGKSATEAQWAGIEALGPSSPGAPNTAGYTMETLGIDTEDIYGLLGDYANEQAEAAANNPTNGDSTNGSSSNGNEGGGSSGSDSSGGCCDSDSCDDSCCDSDSCDDSCCDSDSCCDADCCVADEPEPCSGDICVQD